MQVDNANLIMPNLWLGNMFAAHDEYFIKSNNINLVINCSKDIEIPEWYERHGVAAIRLAINDANTDVDNHKLDSNIDDLVNVIHEYRKEGKNVLVHCYAGMQRSATVVGSYLIKRYDHRPEHAIFYVRHKRPIAFTPKPTFGGFIKKQKKMKI